MTHPKQSFHERHFKLVMLHICLEHTFDPQYIRCGPVFDLCTLWPDPKRFFLPNAKKNWNIGGLGEIFYIQSWLTWLGHQKKMTQPRSKIFDPEPSLICLENILFYGYSQFGFYYWIWFVTILVVYTYLSNLTSIFSVCIVCAQIKFKPHHPETFLII